MGLPPFHHKRSTCACSSAPGPRQDRGNPDPERFTVQQVYKVLDYLVVGIKYPDCRNYEGRKILVF